MQDDPLPLGEPASKPRLRVLLVDDHPLFRQALAATVRQIDPQIAIAQFETLAEARRAIAADTQDTLVLLDLKLPDSHGIAGLLGLKAQAPDLMVAIVSATDDRDTVLTAQACGAAGFISRLPAWRNCRLRWRACLPGKPGSCRPREMACANHSPRRRRGSWKPCTAG
jgi:DNA-binding NarL/FixJ family response regulator